MDELVTRARAGDADAFGELVDRFERTALAVAYAATGDAAAAGDVAQEAFVRAWQRIGELRDPARFGTWLTVIVRRAAADAVRTRRPAVPLGGTTDDMAAPCDSNDPVDRHARAEARVAVERALTSLDELTRAAVVPRYFDDQTSKQIGDRLGLSPAAVDMRLSRARTQLREHLAAYGEPAVNNPWAATGGPDRRKGHE